MWATYVFIAVSLACANGYSSGAPESVCQDMVPKHPVPPQSTPPPYTITTSTKVYTTILCLTMCNGRKFKANKI